jgi:tetratricopeptide (TPR) repeat protein
MTKLSKVIRTLLLAVFFFTPLLFTYFNSELFELPKMYFVYTLTILITVLHLINVIAQKSPLFKKNILNFPLLLFFGSQLISTLISVDPHTSIFGYYSRLNGGLISVVCYLVLYFISSVYVDENFKKSFIVASLISGTFIAVFGIAEHFGIDKNMWIQDVQTRVFSTLGQPNWLAAYLCILMPLSLSKSIEYLNKKKNFLAGLFGSQFLVFYTCLLFTKSKSGIIAAVVSVVLYVFLVLLKALKSKELKTNLSIIVPTLLFVVLLSVFINNPIKDRIFPKKTETVAIVNTQTALINITPSEDIRKIVWKGAAELWRKYPVFGTGTETFAYTYYWTRPIEHNLTSEWDFLYNKAHNEYINYLSTTGAVGLVAYLLIIAAMIFVCLKNSEYAVLASLTSILITNIAGFTVVVVSLFFFVIPAFAEISDQKDQEKFTPKEIPSLLYALIFVAILFSPYFLYKDILYYFADIAYAKSESADAKKDYQNAYTFSKLSLKYNPTEPLYYNQTSILASKMAILANSQKNTDAVQNYTDEAVNYSNKAVEISPANTNLWKERAQAFYYLATINPKHFQESINSLSKVTKLAPTDAKAYYLLGQFYNSAGFAQEASKNYQKAIELKPNYDHAYFALGVIQFDQKQYPDAKNNFDAAIKINPQNIDAKRFLDEIAKQK